MYDILSRVVIIHPSFQMILKLPQSGVLDMLYSELSICRIPLIQVLPKLFCSSGMITPFKHSSVVFVTSNYF